MAGVNCGRRARVTELANNFGYPVDTVGQQAFHISARRQDFRRMDSHALSTRKQSTIGRNVN